MRRVKMLSRIGLQESVMDCSNGYERIAAKYIAARTSSLTGVAQITEWVSTLHPQSKVLDMGCGNGIPVVQVLIAAGHSPFAIDASSSMIREFKMAFPGIPARCEAVEHSDFFAAQFDAVVSIGLVFLLEEATQLALLQRIGEVLLPGGRFLFSAPTETGKWLDFMTGKESVSLGKERYERALNAAGLILQKCFSDEGRNNYYCSVKTDS